jgi:hypothetical protein
MLRMRQPKAKGPDGSGSGSDPHHYRSARRDEGGSHGLSLLPRPPIHAYMHPGCYMHHGWGRDAHISGPW